MDVLQRAWARAVRSFAAARRCGATAWEFDWRFGAEDPAFAGHFPHQPILPGVFLVEMAQRAAEHALQQESGQPHWVQKVQRFRFLAPVLPGDACSLRLEWTPPEVDAAELLLRARFSKSGLAVAQGLLVLRSGPRPASRLQ